MSNEPLNGLIADRRRQAVSTQRGYAYQAWQSVYQWITLKSDEVLFLEGAEDLDVLKTSQEAGEEATTIQVKETRGSGSVTLNSEDVLDSIGHFWDHQNNNPSVTIRFHFLTTSERGYEQNRPFGDMRGLDYWDTCKRSGTDLAPIRSFLQSKDALPSTLRDFVASASDEELRERLIRRILWDTGNEPQSYVEELIERNVIDYGVRIHSLTPDESLNVIPHLFKRVWDVVCQDENRRLDYSDFARLFQEVATERIGSAELQELRRKARLLQSNLSGFASGTAGTSLHTLSSSAPITIPQQHRLARRDELVNNLRSRLPISGLLVLRGSTAAGKSTLAGLLIAELAGVRWRQLDMRGLEPQQVRERLLYVASADAQESLNDNYVIDDLNFDRQPETYENALAALIYVVRQRGGQIIITTQGELPHRLRLLFGLPDDCSVNVPLLNEEEIREVAVNYNCPVGEKLDTWVRIITANTGGHPLLVHARIKNLDAAGWPTPTAQDIFTPESIQDIRREVRRRFQELLPSESARTLAYRLSIFTASFKRNHALSIGQFPPPIANPGEAFELLVGPWIERMSGGYYRLSPLLSGSTDDVLTQQQIKDLHQAAAESYLTDMSWTQRELFGALFHGILGDAVRPLLAALNAALSLDGDDWAVISRQLDIFAYMRLQPGEKLFVADQLLSIMLRWLQFRIAAEVDPAKTAVGVVERWDEELEAFDEARAYPGTLLLMQFTFANHTLIHFEVPLPMRRIVQNLALILTSLPQALAQVENPMLRATFGKNAELWGDTQFYVMAVAMRCKSIEHLEEFTSELVRQQAEVTQVILSEFKENNYLATLLIDAAWLNESRKDTPNWAQCIEVLNKVAQLGIEHQSESLIAAAYRAKAIVFREYLEDSAKAHQALDEGKEKIGYEHVLLRDYRAKLLSLDKQYDDALSIWESATSELEDEQNPQRVFSYRDAEIAAIGINDWGQAASLALKAEEAARAVPFKDDLAIGFHADYAFALWMAGDRAASLSAFIEIMDMLRQLPSPDEDIKSYALYRKVSHTIAWLKQDIEGGDKLPQPPAGWHSDQSAEAERQEPIQSEVFFWYYLAEIEFALGVGKTAFNRFEEAARPSDLPHVRASVATLRLRHALQSSTTFATLGSEIAAFIAQLFDYAEAKGEIRDKKSQAEIVIPFLFAALTIRISLHIYPDSTVIKQWREDLEGHDLATEGLHEWLDFVEKGAEIQQSELISVMRDNNAKTEIRLIAALLLSADESTDPENLFYANTVLITTPNAFGLWQEDVASRVAELITKGWRRVAEHERFALRAPNLTVPAILNACAQESNGFKRAARVLLAARSAVQTSLSDPLLKQLKTMAEQE